MNIDVSEKIKWDLYDTLDTIINNRCVTLMSCFSHTYSHYCLTKDPDYNWLEKFDNKVNNLNFIGYMILLFNDFDTIRKRYLEHVKWNDENYKQTSNAYIFDLYNILNDDKIYLMIHHFWGKQHLDEFVNKINKFNVDMNEIQKYYIKPIEKINIPENILNENLIVNETQYTYINKFVVKMLDIIFFNENYNIDLQNLKLTTMHIKKIITFIKMMQLALYEQQKQMFSHLKLEIQTHLSYNYY